MNSFIAITNLNESYCRLFSDYITKYFCIINSCFSYLSFFIWFFYKLPIFLTLNYPQFLTKKKLPPTFRFPLFELVTGFYLFIYKFTNFIIELSLLFCLTTFQNYLIFLEKTNHRVITKISWIKLATSFVLLTLFCILLTDYVLLIFNNALN